MALSFVLVWLAAAPQVLLTNALIRRHLRALLRHPLTTHHRASSLRPSFFAGLFVFLLTCGAALALAAGAATAHQMLSSVVPRMAATCGGAVGGLALLLAMVLPFAFVPLVLCDPHAPAVDVGQAFVGSARSVSALSWGRKLSLCCVPTLVLSAPLVAAGLLDRAGYAHSWLLPPLAFAVLMPPTTAFYVSCYGRVRSEWLSPAAAPGTAEEGVSIPPSARAGLVTAALSSLVLAGAATAALATPLPLHLTSSVVPALHASHGPVHMGAERVIVRPHALGITIAAQDGGGAGLIHSPCGPIDGVWVVPVSDDRFHITGWCQGWEAVETEVNAQGVRFDDGILDRLHRRVGIFALALCASALWLWVWTLARAWTPLQAARFLQHLTPSDAHRPSAGLRVLEGRLRLPEGGLLRLHQHHFEVEEAAYVEKDGFRIRLPEQGAVLKGAGVRQLAMLGDGVSVAVVAEFDRLVSEGVREHAVPWPANARLVHGDRRRASEVMTQRLARRVVGSLAAVTLIQLVAAATIALSF